MKKEQNLAIILTDAVKLAHPSKIYMRSVPNNKRKSSVWVRRWYRQCTRGQLLSIIAVLF